MKVKCLAQEHNTMSPATARTRTTRSGVKRPNHEATALPTCWCTEQGIKMSFGNLIILLCKTCGAIFHCFAHQHDRLITWTQTKNRRLKQSGSFNGIRTHDICDAFIYLKERNVTNNGWFVVKGLLNLPNPERLCTKEIKKCSCYLNLRPGQTLATFQRNILQH